MRTSCLLLLACLTLAHAGRAQGSGSEEVPRVFRAGRDGLVQATRPDTPLVFGFEDGGTRYLVEIARDAVTARAGDRPLAPDRVRASEHRVEVLDGGGAVMARILTTATGGTLLVFPDRHKVGLGVRLLPASASAAAAAGRAAADLRLVGSVVPGLGAAAAGVLPGDLLVAVDGGPAHEDRLRALLATKKAGDPVRVQLLRGGAPLVLDVVLQPAPSPPPPVGRAPAIEFRDGMLVVLETPDERPAVRAEPAGADIATELAAVRARLGELEVLVRRLVDKGK